MKFDENKVDGATLALLWLNNFEDKSEIRAWKSFDWDALDRLHEKGYISDPKSKAKSVIITDQGAEQAKKLFEQMFTPSK